MVQEQFWTIDYILGFCALITGIIYVILAAFRFRICWIFGGISSALLVYTLLRHHFYVDSVINIYYVIMAFYAWFSWKVNSPIEDLISRDKLNYHISFLALIVVGSLILGYILNRTTLTPFPYADASVGLISIIATWQSAKKIVQNWIYWIAADVIAAVLYAAKELYFESTLMVVYAAVALFGFYEWKRIFNLQK